MASLRNTVKRNIENALNNSRYTIYDFDIVYPTGADDKEFVVITFRPMVEYRLSIIRIPRDSEYKVDRCPGDEFARQIGTYRNLDNAIRNITDWADEIHVELLARTPIIDEFEQFRESIIKQIDEHINDESVHFTEDEVEVLKEKLDSLAAKMEEVQGRADDQEAEIEKMKKSIESLKSTAANYPKKIWYKTAANKITSIIAVFATSKEGRQLAAKAAEQLLLGEGSVPPQSK